MSGDQKTPRSRAVRSRVMATRASATSVVGTLTSRLTSTFAARLAGRGRETGSAVVEFLGVALLLLVPMVYLVLTVGRIQAAVFAAEGAAREAGRIVVRAETFEEGAARARAAVGLAFDDQGIPVSGADALRFSCESDPCLTPGGRIVVEVRAAVGLPGVPEFARGIVPAEVPVAAEYVAVVDEFREVTAP